MEVVIPPRDHGPTTYKYEWDENGEVVSTQRITDPAAVPESSHRGRSRQTVMWPFQSIATDSMISSPLAARFPSFRRATWQARGLMRMRDSTTSDTDSTLIPDYVVNYIRGETPETVARRKKNGGKLAERDVDIEHQHKPQRSQAALREFYDAGGYRRSGVSGSSSEIERVMLAHGGEKPVRRPPRRLAHGWRGGVALNAMLLFLVLLVGIICLVLAVVRSHVFAGDTTILTGSCASVDGLNRGLHAIISIMVLIIVAGANYVFQVLTSPTRPELAAAHDRKRWLDIGIPSLRNLATISNGRSLLALTVVAAAVATQVIYNSIIFTTKVGVDPRLVFVTQSFLTGEAFSNATTNNAAGLSRIDILDLQRLAGQKVLVNMTIEECMDEFSGAFNSDFRAALFVTDVVAPSSSVLQTTTQASQLSLSPSEAKDSINAARAATQFCLAERDLDEHTCDLTLNGALLAVVVLLNIITILATTAVLFKSSFRPIVTIGDAIASFLEDPDKTTEGSCLMTKADILQNRWGLGEAKHWESKQHLWFYSASMLRWLSWAIVWLVLAGLSIAGLAVSITAQPEGKLLPFGDISPQSVYILPSSLPKSAVAIIAALPQVLLATLYFTTNSLLTNLFLSHEFSQFALVSTPLRVSAGPRGVQVTSFYLTLPRVYSWVLVVLFVVLAFILSQSLAAVSIDTGIGGKAAAGVALDGTALLVFVVLLAVLALPVLGLGFRTAPAVVAANGEAVGNPLSLAGGSCSAVVAARCQEVPGEREEAWTKPVAWGVVMEGAASVGGSGKCGFSAGRVGQLDLGRSYG